MNTATETKSRKEDHKEHISRTFHLRFGVILLNSKTERYIISRVDTEDYPLVFLREWIDDPYISDIGPSVLDDMIPEEWYDVWKEMEGIITSTKHITGYWECDVEEKCL